MKVEQLQGEDIQIIVDGFQQAHWIKPSSTFKTYFQEQLLGSRLVWVAYFQNEFAGYVTLKWHSQYIPFKNKNIPEIADLNILPLFRNKGIGTALLDRSEKEAFKKNSIVGIGCGLYAGKDGGYGSAQRLYIKRGYIPDGNGITYNYKPVVPGGKYPVDDDLVLWFVKDLRDNSLKAV